jgi:ribosome-binding factor A
MEGHRAERVSGALREELSELIGFELSDPRIDMVEVTSVMVTPDFRDAQVRVRFGGSPDGLPKVLEALEGARHFLRRELASRLPLRRIPELHFEADEGSEAGSRIDQLLKRVHKQQRQARAMGEKKS